jgi:small subunit ribosomal protein S4
MNRSVKSACKVCRRENQKLFLKGSRCFTDKCSYDRRPYPPGQHGQSRLKFSEYALQLREKQKAKRYYGLSEKQFVRYLENAESSKDVTGTALLKMLETRLDNVVYSLGFSSSKLDAKQLISHNHILVNGKRVNISSYNVKKGDVVSLSEASKNSVRVQTARQLATSRQSLPWLDFDESSFKGTVKDMPTREDITLQVEESMIVEYYSR